MNVVLRKKPVLLVISLFLILGALIVGRSFRYTPSGKYSEEYKKISVEGWSKVADSPQYTIFFSGLREGSIVVVLDKYIDTIFSPDESCEVPILSTDKASAMRENPNNQFHNETVGITVLSPYKSIHLKEGTHNTFTQSVLNGGCAIEEGEISLFTDEKKNEVFCTISVQYKFLHC